MLDQNNLPKSQIQQNNKSKSKDEMYKAWNLIFFLFIQDQNDAKIKQVQPINEISTKNKKKTFFFTFL